MANEPVESLAPTLPDGLVAVVKRDCPTCELIAPVLAEIRAGDRPLTVYTQDDPAFPESIPDVVDDTDLTVSYHHEIETVPTLITVSGGAESARIVGWDRGRWEALSGVGDLGSDLPDQRPGCGSLSVDPDRVDELAVRFGGSVLHARRVEIARLEDEMEAMFDRGWTDGLPIIPPTEARVLRMLEGTSRSPDDVVATVPPDLVECTVEKVAVNAVMAGCKPEYLPVVLASVEAACTNTFNMHGVLATTFFSGPVIIVNGPIATAIGMNSGTNCMGQGNRANLTIGRALQLVVRNIGGGEPGGVDRAMMGSPGKLSFCFSERETGSPWESLAVERGFRADESTVTLFAGQGPTPIVDQLSRTPESLARTLARSLQACHHPKLRRGWDAMLVVSPEHSRVFAQAGWDKARFRRELEELLVSEADSALRGADGIAEGLPASVAGRRVAKFRDGGLLICHAGGDAGMFSAIITGWSGGPMGSEPTTNAISPWM